MDEITLSKVFRLVHDEISNYGGVAIANELMGEYVEYIYQIDEGQKVL